MPKSPKFINTSGEEEEKLGTCTNNHARAVPQRTFHQERRQEHFPRYLYSSQIGSKMTETTRV